MYSLPGQILFGQIVEGLDVGLQTRHSQDGGLEQKQKLQFYFILFLFFPGLLINNNKTRAKAIAKKHDKVTKEAKKYCDQKSSQNNFFISLWTCFHCLFSHFKNKLSQK